MNAVLVVIAMGFFIFGMWLMGNAEYAIGFQAITFFCGILSVGLALAIPANILGRGNNS